MNEEKVEQAIDLLNDIERAEGDEAHKQDIADVRHMIVGVYGLEKYHDDFEDDERVDVLREVLDGIDPDDQPYARAEAVEELKNVGRDFAALYDR